MSIIAGLAAVLVAGCCLIYLAFLFYAGTDSYQLLSLNHVNKSLAISSIPGEETLCLICTWGSLLLATLTTLLLRRLASARWGVSARSKVSGGLVQQARRALAWQLPPRAFLAGWCGGLSVGEVAGVLGWLALNAFWLGEGLTREFLGVYTWDGKLKGAAKLLGQMLAPNLMLLFLPIPHTNVFTWITGVSRNHLIRYHRWLGHGTLWIVFLHAMLYYIYWGTTHQFWVNAQAWNSDAGVNNLAGSLAFFFALALWVTSLTWVRRHFYELFFRFHIGCFLGFFLLSCAHYPGCWLFFTPGLLLYAADLALRAGQMSNITTVTAATVDEDLGVATLLLDTDKATKHRPLSEIWLLLPGLSRWQWHPFSVASGGGSTLKLHIKRYGRFTKGLLAALRQRQPLAVRFSGPMGSEVTADCQLTPPPSYAQHDVVVMVCGGVGATAMLSMLRAMVAAREAAAAGAAGGAGRAQGGPCLPRKVVCVWTARHIGEFLALDGALLMASAHQGGWLTFQLHLTGGPSSAGPGARQLPGQQGGRPSSSASSLKHGSSKETVGAPDAPAHIPGASAYFWDLLRPAQPLSFGTLHLAAVYLLTFFGAFCAALIGTSYLSDMAVSPWEGGMLICVLISFVSMGLPFFLVVFPVHAIRYWWAARSARAADTAAEERMAVPYSKQAELEDQACIVTSNAVVLPGEGLSLIPRLGRPDVAAVLCAAAALSGADTVGVFAGGPSGLMQAVHLAVCQLNDERQGPYFDLHKEAVEL